MQSALDAFTDKTTKGREMTQPTEQDRAEFEAVARKEWKWPDEFFWRHSETGEFTRECTTYAWDAWQAARRAQVVPQGWATMFGNPLEHFFRGGESLCGVYSISPEIDLSEAPRIGKYACTVCKKALAAEAPQPPEAACNPSMQPELATKAAPVQMPEHDAGWFKYDKVSRCWHPQYSEYAETHAKREGWQKLYTEHQVRQLLAAHGIAKN